MLGITKPRNPILGWAFSGEIESVGNKITKYKKGDKIYGCTGMKFGTHAEYISLPENIIMTFRPENATHEEAVSIPFGGTTALFFLRKAGIKSGDKVLIYGASGAVGTSAIQIAKYFGAVVTGVCGNSNLEFVRKLGADYVLDYKSTEYDENIEKYDIIFDAVGKTTFKKLKNNLKKDGRYVSVNNGMADEKIEDFLLLKELFEKNRIKAVIDKIYNLEDIVEAHKYVETGHKKGNVVIKIT